MAKALRGTVERRMRNAYEMKTYDQALNELKKLITWLRDRSDKAAGSLAEGLEETLTVWASFSSTWSIAGQVNQLKAERLPCGADVVYASQIADRAGHCDTLTGSIMLQSAAGQNAEMMTIATQLADLIVRRGRSR